LRAGPSRPRAAGGIITKPNIKKFAGRPPWSGGLGESARRRVGRPEGGCVCGRQLAAVRNGRLSAGTAADWCAVGEADLVQEHKASTEAEAIVFARARCCAGMKEIHSPACVLEASRMDESVDCDDEG